MLGSEQTAQSLDDHARIACLLARYFQIVDAGERADVAGLFTADGEFHGIDGTFAGTAALIDFFGAAGTERDRRRYGGGVHIVSPPVIEVTGDEATAWSSAIYVVPAESGPRIVFSGEYNDVLHKLNGHWLIVTRKVTSRSVAN